MEESGQAGPRAGRRGVVALLLGGSVVLSRLLGYVREAVLAGQLGVGPEADAYRAAFLLPDLLGHFLTGGALSIAFIPFYTRLRTREGNAAAERLLAVVLGTLGAVVVVATVLLAWWAEELVEMDFDGYAIGGGSVGEPEPEMMHAVEITEPHLPADKARYAMGLGTPAQLIELVARGVDMFDCVLPTRVARNGTAYTSSGAINLRASHQKEEFGPIEEGCECFACTHHTRAYLRHLLKAGEILGLRMLSVHNSHFFLEVMRDIRRHLAGGTFDSYREDFIGNYQPTSKVLEGRANSRLPK